MFVYGMNLCYYFIDLQQKAIFSKNWGGPEKDRFLGVFWFFIFFFFWFFSKSFWFQGFSSLFFLLYFSLSFSLLFFHCSTSSVRSSSTSSSSESSSSSHWSFFFGSLFLVFLGGSTPSLALPMPHNTTPVLTPLLPLPRRLLYTTRVSCSRLMGVILL